MAPRGQLPGPSSGIPDRRDSKRNGGFNQQKLLEGGHEWAVVRLLAQEGAKQSPLELPVTPEETEKNKWTLKDSLQPASTPFPLESVQPGLDSLSQGFRIQMSYKTSQGHQAGMVVQTFDPSTSDGSL